MEQTLVLRDAIPTILELLKAYDYSVEYINTFKRHLTHVVNVYASFGIVHYTPGQYKKFLICIATEYAAGDLRRDLFWSYRKCAYYLDEFCVSGCIHPRMLVQKSGSVLTDVFEQALEMYLLSLVPKIRSSTITQRKYAIQRYLHHLHEAGCETFENIRIADVRQYFMCMAKEVSNRTLNQHRLHIRQFHGYLAETGQFTPNWLSFFDFKVAIPQKIQGYLTTEETDSILTCINRESPLGKRDFAIISLARTTGLRGGDILNLKLGDANWESGVITICQQKTRVTHCIPLLAESREALKDYILHGRPKTNSPEIFVRANAPYTALRSTSSLDALLRKYQLHANQSYHPWDGKAFHGTRRGLGRNLVMAGVPVTSIMQILGHSHLNSSKLYMILNTPELRECTLSFTDIPVKRDELL